MGVHLLARALVFQIGGHGGGGARKLEELRVELRDACGEGGAVRVNDEELPCERVLHLHALARRLEARAAPYQFTDHRKPSLRWCACIELRRGAQCEALRGVRAQHSAA